ncbi:grifin isoform X1 [Lithobates pipiens]
MELTIHGIEFEASCPQGICPGWSIIVKGERGFSGKNFEINFLNDSEDQTAFHLKSCFAEDTIICNSFLSGDWGQEEQIDPSPLEANEPFQIEIHSDREHFQVFINDSMSIQYCHRMKHFSGITKLRILNDINISSVEITKREMNE